MPVEGLPIATLADLVVERKERTVVKAADKPYLGLEHLLSGSPDLIGSAPSSSSTSMNNVFHTNDILFGKLRPYLRKSVLAPFDGYCSTDIIVLRANAGISPAFAAKMFQSGPVFATAISTSVGTKMPRTAWSAVRRLEVFCPEIEEQTRIATVLDTLDNTIRQTEQVIAKLHQMKQGLLHDLLTRGIDENGEVRDPEQRPELFRDSVLGRIPKHWEVTPLERYARPGRSFLKTGPFGSSLKGEHWTETGVPVITIGALGEGKFINSELLYISVRKATELSAYAVESGDIVFSRVADVGRSVAVQEPQTGWIMSSNLMWISLDGERIHPEMVWLNLSANPRVRCQVRQNVNAGGREVANGTVLRSLRFAWPPKTEQDRIVTLARSLQERESNEEVELGKLRRLQEGLMDDLLTGKVRTPATVEVAV